MDEIDYEELAEMMTQWIKEEHEAMMREGMMDE